MLDQDSNRFASVLSNNVHQPWPLALNIVTALLASYSEFYLLHEW